MMATKKRDNMKKLKTPYKLNNKPIYFKILNTNIVNEKIQDGLKISLKQTGQQSSVKLCDKGDHYDIEDGTHRVQAFIDMGYSEKDIQWKIIKEGELDSYSLEMNYLRGNPAPMIVALKLQEWKKGFMLV